MIYCQEKFACKIILYKEKGSKAVKNCYGHKIVTQGPECVKRPVMYKGKLVFLTAASKTILTKKETISVRQPIYCQKHCQLSILNITHMWLLLPYWQEQRDQY